MQESEPPAAHRSEASALGSRPPRSDPLDRFLDELAAPAPSPCGGTAAATAAAMAAALVVMVARGSPGWADGADTTARAQALRRRLVSLGGDDATVFAGVIAASRDRSGTPAQRTSAVAAALVEAAVVPLRIAEAAADVAALAVLAAAEGSAHLRPDATVAATLAEGAARAASLLVEVDLAAVAEDQHPERAGLLAAAATAAARAERLVRDGRARPA